MNPSPSLPAGENALAQITVSSRIPDFWKESPRLWFAQFEAVVANQKLADESRYNLVIAKLSREHVEQVSDIVLTPPDTKKYEALKTRLLVVYEESEVRQVQKLLKELELGDQKPSQLLRRMRDLAKKKFNDETLNMLWMGHLPSAVQAILTVSEVKDLEKLAGMADKVVETTRFAEIQELSCMRSSAVPSSSATQATLVEQIAQLTRRLDNMETSRSRGRSVGRNGWKSHRSASRSRDRSERVRRGDPNWMCFYHFRYKGKANKCIQPCAWQKQQESEAGKN
ncbi:uncharacterized protein LOC125490797 [Plutella xylostella]|uniref:uncharacterized protein LOC125489251 n=1 Tax=Plutella xylostella TaxID=51655 RepID=UPI0005D0811C|nr:uncharacterized protein LOC125489251 [Plutella xylostella]XP_048480521.1 uncharacterized protein LOC125489263 [Plutella xylostella]XP_048484614.1 uncharacterized protein LOC125490193 [Plutella xylostella]XP_048485059.1 uncharacterized protein LOC125490288 [Plutella xylostella]XP_048487079.1 uncharacterized protein LOC125490797 [Plutella xylostella]